MLHRLICAAALLSAPAAEAAILYQSTLAANGGNVVFDDVLYNPAVTASGTTFLAISGGSLTGASWEVFGDFTKLWWEIVDVDDEGNPVYYLNGNEYFYYNGCSVTPGAPDCSNPGSLRTRLKNDITRVDFTAPTSFNNCFPFNGVVNVDCAILYNLAGATFQVGAFGPGDVTLTIYDSPIPGAVPEPASWALLIAGFGLTGAALRRRRAQPVSRARAA